MSLKLEDCDGDVERWFIFSFDDFQADIEALKKTGNTEGIRSLLKSFEETMALAAKAGIEDSRAYGLVARLSTLPRLRMAYFARAYELLVEERKVHTFRDMPCSLGHHYTLADYLFQMARIHESDGQMKAAADLYQRSLQHLQNGADACDAELNDNNRGVPRRPEYTASFARVQKFLT